MKQKKNEATDSQRDRCGHQASPTHSTTSRSTQKIRIMKREREKKNNDNIRAGLFRLCACGRPTKKKKKTQKLLLVTNALDRSTPSAHKSSQVTAESSGGNLH